MFAEAGTVQSANIIEDRETGRSRGFAFVEMSTDEEAKKAIASLDGKEIDGRNLKVNEAKPREDRGGKVFLDATRAGGATVVAAYSPRARPGMPVSFPVAWDDLGRVAPADFTVHTVPPLLAGGDPWAGQMPPAQPLSTDLVEEGHTIPVARVQAMHEGKRRARARRSPPE